MDPLNIIAILLSIFLGGFSVFYRTKYINAKSALTELVAAIEDDKITKDELIRLIRAFYSIIV
jgi:hypothetical protein